MSARDRAVARLAERAALGRAVVGVVLGSLVIHAIALACYHKNPFRTTLIGDAQSYVSWSERIERNGLSAEPVFHQAPLFPVMLAAIGSVTGVASRPLVFALSLVVLNTLALVLLILVGWVWFGSIGAGLGAALLGLLHGPFVFYGLKLLPGPLALVGQGATLVLLGLARSRGTAGLAVATGGICGLACLARPEFLLFVPVAGAAIVTAGGGWRPAGRRLVAFALGLAFGIFPATVHNLRHGDRVLIASSAGENLFIGNQPAQTGGHAALDPRAGDLLSQRALAEILAEADRQRQLLPSEVSAYWTQRTVRAIAANPGAWASRVVLKLGRVLHPGDPTDLYSFAAERARYLWVLWLLPATPWTILFLAAIGLVLARAPGRDDSVWPLAWCPVVLLVALLVFFVDTRLRLPWLYSLLPFAGLALDTAWTRWRAREHRRRVLTLAGVALIATMAGAWRTEATPRDWVRLASVLSQQGRLDEALTVLAPLLDVAAPDPFALDSAGWVLQKKGDLAAARQRYESALELGLPASREPQTRSRLAAVLEAGGDIDGAAREHLRAAANPAGGAGAHYERARFLLRRGEIDGARRAFESAAQIEPEWDEPRRALDALARRER